MPQKLILFAGAPEAELLNWDVSLRETFDEPVARFAQLGGYEKNTSPYSTSSGPIHPYWRSLPLDRQYLTTGVSQDHAWREEYQGVDFFATSYIDSLIEGLSQPTGDTQESSAKSVEQVLSQFYEESYAIHRDIPSSQIAIVSQAESSFSTEEITSFNTTESFTSQKSLGQRKAIPQSGHLSRLNGIPNAAYLNSIQPQTMTVNLIVGIVSNPSPRAIQTRRGADVELVELLVGDETKSGFGINFWLDPSQTVQENSGAILRSLRPQDVILMRNVALSSFRGKVYGQSLRQDMTKIFLLYRNRLDKTDIGGCYSAADLAATETKNPQVEMTLRVKEWVMKFVGIGQNSGVEGGKRSKKLRREILPPDTQ